MNTFNTRAFRLLIGTLLAALALAGCDRRGPNERAIDAEIQKVERDPHLSQTDKDNSILFYDAMKSTAKDTDKQIAAMPPEQRDAMTRMERLQSAGQATTPEQDTDVYTLPAYRETSLYMGMGYAPLNRGNARSIGIAFGSGIYVESVASNSPAAQAGVQVGDFVDAADGNVLNGTFNIGDALYQHAHNNPLQGQPITLHLCRAGQWANVQVYPTSR